MYTYTYIHIYIYKYIYIYILYKSYHTTHTDRFISPSTMTYVVFNLECKIHLLGVW